MSDLKICRICLRTECKVYKYDQFQLKPYYEEVMAMKVNDKDGLPQYFCYECATMLHKFHKFKEKCYMGQKTLREISWRGDITYEAVYKIDRKRKNLKSSLDFLIVSHRIRTYCTEDIMKCSDSEPESVKIEDEIEFKSEIKDSHKDIAAQYISEESMTDGDDQFYPDSDPVDENSKIECENVNKDDNLHIPKEILEHQVNNKPKSPETVFVDIKKEIVTLKSLQMKEKRKKTVLEYALTKQFTKKKTKILSASNWKKSMLSEEEAIQRFRARSEDPKYVSARYKCADCFKGFSQEDMLKRHKLLRHSETLGALECNFCHMRFKWDCFLRKHMRSHYTKFECLRCNLVCPLETTAELHDDYHNGVINKCRLCNEEFKHKSSYYSHLRTHRSNYVCTLCGVSFVSSMGLQMHKKVKHITEEIESPDDDEPLNTFCKKCNIRFETRKAYEEHLFQSTMHPDIVLEEEALTDIIPRKVLGKRLKAKITNDLKERTEDQMPMPKAKRRTKRRQQKKPTTCHQCGKHFDTQAACMKHHLAEHPRTSFFSPNERHICEICGASLAPGSVAMHQNMHSREKEHKCETCGRSFYASVSLKRHMLTHTGEKPFACTLCDKRFTQSNSRKLHYRTFHLKEPYPKRNRRKKKNDPPDAAEQEKNSSSEEESSDSLPEPEPAPAHPPGQQQDAVHYLTLS